MSGFEFQVRSMLEAGDVVDYAVTPIYRGSDLVPVGITMKADSADGLVFWTSILDRGS